MKGQAERVARKTKEGGNVQNGGEVEKMPFFLNAGIALTAVWQRRPRQCLLEF